MHKNVVKCLGVCFEEHPRYIILELLEGGDLKTFLRDSRPRAVSDDVNVVTSTQLIFTTHGQTLIRIVRLRRSDWYCCLDNDNKEM